MKKDLSGKHRSEKCGYSFSPVPALVTVHDQHLSDFTQILAGKALTESLEKDRQDALILIVDCQIDRHLLWFLRLTYDMQLLVVLRTYLDCQ